MAVYPTVESLMAGANSEGVFLEVRRSPRSILSLFCLFVGLTLVVVAINIVLHDWSLPSSWGPLAWISPRWLAVFPALVLLEIIRRSYDDLYVFTLEGVKAYDGRLSLNYSVPVVRYTHVREVLVVQDIIGRIFDYGDVKLGTAAQDGYELIMKGVRAPTELEQIISGMKRFNQSLDRSKDEQGSSPTTEAFSGD